MNPIPIPKGIGGPLIGTHNQGRAGPKCAHCCGGMTSTSATLLVRQTWWGVGVWEWEWECGSGSEAFWQQLSVSFSVE